MPRGSKRAAASAAKAPLADFYAGAVLETDRLALAAARDLSGLEEEIALLRLRLRGLIVEKPDDFRLVLQGMNTLVRAVVAEYRLATPDQQERVQRMVETFRQLSPLLSEDRGPGAGD